jgi:hypothetical protein
MSNNTDFLGRAIDTVKKAIENDNEGEYEKAYQQYYSALELFMLALKWEKNPRSKEMIRAKTGEYMDRAEKLKNHLASADNRKKPSALGSNGSVAQGSGKGEYVHPPICEGNINANGNLAARKTIVKMPMRKSSGLLFRARSCLTSRISSGRMLRA